MYIRNILKTPAPKVYAWNSRSDNTVGAEYIIMEKMPGTQLYHVWNSMKLVEKMQLRLNLAQLQKAWLSASFSQFGGLYYAKDLGCKPSKFYLYTDEQGEKKHDSRFAIGPTTGRDWFDCERKELKIDRGPCKLHHFLGCSYTDICRAQCV